MKYLLRKCEYDNAADRSSFAPVCGCFLSQKLILDVIKFVCGIVFAGLVRDTLDAAATDGKNRSAVKAWLIAGGLADLHRIG